MPAETLAAYADVHTLVGVAVSLACVAAFTLGIVVARALW